VEAFEQFVALAMESEGFLVSGPHKFMVKKQTKKKTSVEFQTHGYEVDLIGIRKDRLVLATVKSFFGSAGVKPAEVMGRGKAGSSGYKMINNLELRDEMIRQAAVTYGFSERDVEMRLYGGKFMSKKGELELRKWAAEQQVGAGAIGIYNASEVVAAVRTLQSTTYRDNPILVTLKVLDAAGALLPANEMKVEN
jgi:hypothetical protein